LPDAPLAAPLPVQAEVNGVLFYDCPEATMEKRLLRRGETSGRSDDTADVIRKRFHTYVNATMPVVNHYAAQVRRAGRPKSDGRC
jgi:adenylate kinase family enzyme